MATKKAVSGSLLLVLLALAFVVPAAEAHARYVRSEPAFGSALKDPPNRVTVWFSEELARGSQIKVFDQGGQRVDNDNTQVSMSDPKSMTVGLKTLSTGAFLVAWESISLEDKDAAEGSFTFSVGGPAGQGVTGVLGLGGAVLAIVVASLALLKSRRRAA